MIIFMVMKLVVTKMTVSGTDIVYPCLDVDQLYYSIFVSIYVFTCKLHYLKLIFIYKTDKYSNTISKQYTNTKFKLLKVIFTKLKTLLISVKLIILLVMLMSKMILIRW